MTNMYCGPTWCLMLKSKTVCTVFLLSLLMLLPVSVSAHGTGYRQLSNAKAISVEFYYSTGEPMLFAEVFVFSPQDKQMEFQNGRTDKKGRFSFYPDCSGNWQIIVKDGMGHSVNTSFDVENSKDNNNPTILKTSKKMPLPQSIITGIGIIFGLFGTMALLSKKRK